LSSPIGGRLAVGVSRCLVLITHRRIIAIAGIGRLIGGGRGYTRAVITIRGSGGVNCGGSW